VELSIADFRLSIEGLDRLPLLCHICSRSDTGGRDDSEQLSRFISHGPDFLPFDFSAIQQQFTPEDRFIGFLFNDSEFVHEIRF